MDSTDLDTSAPASDANNWDNTPMSTSARKPKRNISNKKKQHLRNNENDWYNHAVGILNGHTCRNCGGWDDDDSLGDGVSIAQQIQGTTTHQEYVFLISSLGC